MKWIMVVAMYMAPPSAVDWDGPWKLGMTMTSEDQFDTKAECRTEAIQAIGRIHQGMMAPVRYRCVAIEATLPEGAPR